LYPPRAREHGDVTVVLMEMRAAVVMRQPLLQDDVEAGLARVADQRRRFGGGRLVPLDVGRQSNRDGLRVEIADGAGRNVTAHATQAGEKQGCEGETEAKHKDPPEGD